MTRRLVAAPPVAGEVGAAAEWYEREQPALGDDFLAELGACFERIASGPFGYQELEGGIRRALLRRFPYAVYFAVEEPEVVVLAVLHVSRDPAARPRRG